MRQAPRVLHLATHGFFLLRHNAEGSGVGRALTLSGLALSGANRGLEGRLGPHGEDGILYALEVQDLNLASTELVTLSACDTGQGAVSHTEGVLGLVRAFQMARANRVLMTLWPLDDALAVDFMTDFY
jgi:CHAT domain-containing protein